jgi:hypothetical protein
MAEALHELTIKPSTPRAQADATIRQSPRPGSGSARTQVSPRVLPSADDGAHFSVYLVELACPDPTLLPIAYGQGANGGRSRLGRGALKTALSAGSSRPHAMR